MNDSNKKENIPDKVYRIYLAEKTKNPMFKPKDMAKIIPWIGEGHVKEILIKKTIHVCSKREVDQIFTIIQKHLR